MVLPRVIYITHPEEDFSNLKWIDRLHEGGVRWIQLRIKESDLEAFHPTMHYKSTYMEIADLLREKTKSLGMTLTINDESDVARFCEADGLHIGLTDALEKSEIEEGWIIGGTINTIENASHYAAYDLHYFGAGPLRETETKKNTKTPLGYEGYKKLIAGLSFLNKPVFAIGGIQVEDLKELKAAGVYGIAVSGLFHKNDFDVNLIQTVVNGMS